MIVQMLYVVFATCIFFTYAALQWPERFYLFLFCFALWNGFALLCGNVDIVMAGSVNPIVQSYEAGDPELPESLIYIFHGIGIIMLIAGIAGVWQSVRQEANNQWAHRGGDILRGT